MFHHHKKHALAAVLSLALPAAAIAATDKPATDGAVKVDASVGYDDNVFRLNDTVGAEEAAFVDAGIDATLDHALANDWSVGARFQGRARAHDGAASDADSSNYAFGIRGKRDPAGKGSTTFSWSLDQTVRDSTYVSRATGVVATLGGQSIGNRFDSSKTELSMKLKVPVGGNVRGTLRASASEKDYHDDYQDLGADRLDYTALEVAPGFEWKSGAHDISVLVPLAQRDYRDRRASDLAGAAIAGSDLAYTYQGVELAWDIDLGKVHTLRSKASYSQRQDNEDGYADMTASEIRVGWQGRWRKSDVRASVDLAWSEDKYDRLSDAVQQLNEDAPESKGWSLIGKYEAPLGSKTLSWFAEARLDSYDNDSNNVYSYDRARLALGVEKTFD